MTNEETRICPYCSESILATAKKCKHCGEFIKKPGLSEPAKFTIALFGLIGIVAIINSNSDSGIDSQVVALEQQALAAKKAEQCAAWSDVVKLHTENGLFTKIDKDNREVQVNPAMWSRVSADNKEVIVGNTAKCVFDGAAKFKDRMSGKVLAERGYLSGVKLY